MQGGDTPSVFELPRPANRGDGRARKSGSTAGDYEIRLTWPDYVIAEVGSGRSWTVPVVEAHLLSVIDGRRKFPQLVAETRARIRMRARAAQNVSDRDVNTAFLRLSQGDLLTNRNGFITVSPKYAAIAAGSLSGAIAVLLTRGPNPPLVGA